MRPYSFRLYCSAEHIWLAYWLVLYQHVLSGRVWNWFGDNCGKWIAYKADLLWSRFAKLEICTTLDKFANLLISSNFFFYVADVDGYFFLLFLLPIIPAIFWKNDSMGPQINKFVRNHEKLLFTFLVDQKYACDLMSEIRTFTSKICTLYVDFSCMISRSKIPTMTTEPTAVPTQAPLNICIVKEEGFCQWPDFPCPSRWVHLWLNLCSFHTTSYAKTNKVHPQCLKQSDDYIVALTFEASPCQVSPNLIAHPVHYLP